MVTHFQGFFFLLPCSMPGNFTHSFQEGRRQVYFWFTLLIQVVLWGCNLMWGGSSIRSLTFGEPWILTSVHLADISISGSTEVQMDSLVSAFRSKLAAFFTSLGFCLSLVYPGLSFSVLSYLL